MKYHIVIAFVLGAHFAQAQTDRPSVVSRLYFNAGAVYSGAIFPATYSDPSSFISHATLSDSLHLGAAFGVSNEWQFSPTFGASVGFQFFQWRRYFESHRTLHSDNQLLLDQFETNDIAAFLGNIPLTMAWKTPRGVLFEGGAQLTFYLGGRATYSVLQESPTDPPYFSTYNNVMYLFKATGVGGHFGIGYQIPVRKGSLVVKLVNQTHLTRRYIVADTYQRSYFWTLQAYYSPFEGHKLQPANL